MWQNRSERTSLLQVWENHPWGKSHGAMMSDKLLGPRRSTLTLSRRSHHRAALKSTLLFLTHQHQELRKVKIMRKFRYLPRFSLHSGHYKLKEKITVQLPLWRGEGQ